MEPLLIIYGIQNCLKKGNMNCSEIDDDSIGSIQFRQRWIMKTELQPEIYINEKELGLLIYT